VDAVVEGSVLRAGDKVRITAQLIDARADKHLWAKSFERNSRDVLALQDELASAIAREIDVQLTPSEQSRLTGAPSVNPEAYDAYLKGRYFFNRPSDENLKKAIAQFEEAVKLNPNYAPAFSGLSDAYLWAGYNEGVLTASEARPKAKDAAEKAIQLDNNSAEGHTSLAVFKLFYEYDWAGCESEFRRAIALNPNYAFAHDQFGLGLAFQGRFVESAAEGKRASELDPLSPQIPVDAIFAFAWQGKYQAAKEQVKRAADLDPTFFAPPWAYGWIDIQAGNISAAIPENAEGRSDGVARVCCRMARVRLWGFRRSTSRDGGDGGVKKKVVAWFRYAVQPGARVSRSGRSRARSGLPGAGLRLRFAMDGVAQERPDLRSAPLRAALRCAREEAEIRQVNVGAVASPKQWYWHQYLR
jgi:tetratricopeptide (TPR) repeat protein